MPIIEVEHVTKEYQLGALSSFKDSLANLVRRLTGKPPIERQRFKALDDVSFTVEPGEVVGIIGHNGAGKSTLLKILANVTTPTSGKVTVRGSIAPLIEVGAGINPELTGRENIYLNASILGIPKKTIRQKIDEIIEFSELEQFIDTPVKRYSSGMQVKLGFAIATSLDAEILIIDEVLAVGDLAFQRKCFDRMEELIKRQGKTVLLVSHNLRQIARICSRVIMLDHGKILEDGEPHSVCNVFYEYNNQKIVAQHRKGAQNQPRGNDLIRLEKVEILNRHGNPVDTIHSGDPLSVRVLLEVKQKIEKPEVVIGTHTTDFVYLTANSTDTLPKWPDFDVGTHEITCTIPFFPVKGGVYCVRIAVFNNLRGNLLSEEGLAPFWVITHNESKQPPLRLLNLECNWKHEHYVSINSIPKQLALS
jgi:lipopolysaccharide transport system ATP-binding protein